jgi:hypothetical protein
VISFFQNASFVLDDIKTIANTYNKIVRHQEIYCIIPIVCSRFLQANTDFQSPNKVLFSKAGKLNNWNWSGRHLHSNHLRLRNRKTRNLLDNSNLERKNLVVLPKCAILNFFLLLWHTNGILSHSKMTTTVSQYEHIQSKQCVGQCLQLHVINS